MVISVRKQATQSWILQNGKGVGQEGEVPSPDEVDRYVVQ